MEVVEGEDTTGNIADLHGSYIQLCFCLPSTGLTCSFVINKIEKSMKRLQEYVPWLAGTTTLTKDHHPYLYQNSDEIPLELKMACNPLFNELQKADYPFRSLDEDWIAPCTSTPHSTPHENELPVFVVRINFIPNGLLLVFSSQKSIMDEYGLASVLRLLNKICNDERPHDDELRTINNMIDLIPSTTPPPETTLKAIRTPESLHEATVKTNTDDSHQPQLPRSPNSRPPSFTYLKPFRGIRATTSPEDLKWLYFRINTTLDPLKIDSTPYAMPDIYSVAFLFKAVTMARCKARSRSPAKRAVLARVIDGRPRFGLPQDYPGAATMVVKTTFATEDVLSLPLSEITERALASENPNAQAMLHHVDKTESSVSCSDLEVHSWANVDLYDFTFGIRAPTAVRQPHLKPTEGVAYIMPREHDRGRTRGRCRGDLVAVCLNVDDSEALLSLPHMKENVVYID